MCLLIFLGTNGETYLNTATLVSCVQNFPKSRGPVVGILKGFAGLSGAILTQIYAVVNSPDHASLIFMVAVGPAIVVTSLMFFIRQVGANNKQINASECSSSFSFIYTICLILAAYLMGVMLLQDLVHVSQTMIKVFTVILFILIIIPIVVPVYLSLRSSQESAEEPLLSEPQAKDTGKSKEDNDNILFSEIEDEKPKDVDLLSASERHKRITHLQAKLAHAAAEGAVRIKRRRGPRRGEDFTLTQALIKADFWLIFFSLLFGSGSGLTVIDNLGQMSESLGYDNEEVFVSMISIWNFLGRVGGGYFSEIVVRYVYIYKFHLIPSFI